MLQQNLRMLRACIAYSLRSLFRCVKEKDGNRSHSAPLTWPLPPLHFPFNRTFLPHLNLFPDQRPQVTSTPQGLFQEWAWDPQQPNSKAQFQQDGTFMQERWPLAAWVAKLVWGCFCLGVTPNRKTDLTIEHQGLGLAMPNTTSSTFQEPSR